MTKFGPPSLSYLHPVSPAHAHVARKRLRLTGWLGWIARALLLGGFGAFSASLLIDRRHLLQLPLFGIIAWGTLVVLARALENVWFRHVPVRLEEGALVLGDTRIARSAIAEGLSLREPPGTIELTLTMRDVSILRLANRLEADALLETLGLDATRRRSTVRFGRVYHRVRAGCLGVALAAAFYAAIAAARGLHLTGLLLAAEALTIPIAAIWSARTFGWREVTVGADGVMVRYAVWRRFIAYSSLHDVEVAGALVLRCTDGTTVAVPYDIREYDHAAAVVDRIREAQTRYETGPRVAVLPRAGLSVAQWKRALARSVAGGAYRGGQLATDAALAAAEDASASAEERVGGALALAAAGTDEARQRIRVVAAACTQPRLRVALERAVDGTLDDETLDDALREAPR